MRKKRFTAFLLSLAMAGTSLYTCGVIDVQAAAVAEDEAEVPNLEQLADLQEQDAATEEAGTEDQEQPSEPEEQDAAAEGAEIEDQEQPSEPEAQAAAIEENEEEVLDSEEVADQEQQAAVGYDDAVLAGPVDGKAPWGTVVTIADTGNAIKGYTYSYEIVNGDVTVEAEKAIDDSESWSFNGRGDTPDTYGKYVGCTVKVKKTNTTDKTTTETTYEITARSLSGVVISGSDGVVSGSTAGSQQIIVSYNDNKAPAALNSITVSDPAMGCDLTSMVDTTVVGSVYTAGARTYQLKGSQWYTGTLDIPLTIQPKEIASVNIVTTGKYAYNNGNEVTPDTVAVTDLDGWKLAEGTDYSISWGDNKNVGDKASAYISLNETGSFSKDTGWPAENKFTDIFEVVSKNGVTFDVKINSENELMVPISACDVISSGSLVVSDGSMSVSDGDYEAEVVDAKGTKVASTNALTAGDYTIKVTGKNNFNVDCKGEKAFTVKPRTVSAANLYVSINEGRYQVFNGQEKTVELTVSMDEFVTSQNKFDPAKKKPLKKDTDYTVSYKNAKNVGSEEDANGPKACITLKGDYQLDKEYPVSFNISAADISGPDLKISYNSTGTMTYDGTEQRPKLQITVSLGSTTTPLVEGDDFEYIGSYSVNAGEVKATISGCNNYKGSSVVKYKIDPKNIGDADISWTPDVAPTYEYTGGVIVPTVGFTYPSLPGADKTVASENGTNFTVTVSPNNVKKHNVDDVVNVTITGSGNYTGSVNRTFKVVDRGENATVSVGEIPYTGRSVSKADLVNAGLVVSANGNETIDPSDYDVIVEDGCINARQTYTFKIQGKNDYKQLSETGEFYIAPRNVSGNGFSIKLGKATYGKNGRTKDDKYKLPDLTISDNTNPSLSAADFVEGKDYTFKRVSDNKGVFTLTGTGNFDGVSVNEFAIEKANLGEIEIVPEFLNPSAYVYSGETISINKADIKIVDKTHFDQVLSLNVDYSMGTVEQKVNVGPANVDITAERLPNSDYKGSATIQVSILAKSISESDVQVISKNGYVGEAYALTAEYDGKEHAFASVSGTDVLSTECLSYNGMKLSANDYDVMIMKKDGSVSTNYTDAGTYDIVAKGKGNYEGYRKLGVLTVKGKELAKENFALSWSVNEYKGYPQRPEVKLQNIRLLEGTDYSVSYSNAESKDAGTYTVTVEGKGNYSGTYTYEYTIEAIAIPEDGVVIAPNAVYTGSFAGIVTVTVNGKVLVQGEDYTVEGSPAVGTQTLTVKGNGNYTGTFTGTCTISKLSLKGAKVTVPSVTYTGASQKAKVKSVVLDGKTLKEGTDYTVKAVSRTKVGKSTVTVTGIGNYTDTATGTFTVNAISISKGKVSGIKDKTYTGKNIKQSVKLVVNGKTLKLNTDYTVAYKNNKNIGQATVTIKGKGNYKDTITKTFKILPKKAEIKSLKAGSKRFTVTAKKQSGGVKYQVQYKLKGAKSYKTNKATTQTQTIKSLKKGKTYTVRIRTYKKVSGKTYYGSFSKTKNVKVK